jgi:large subunit ribosomal protein L23
MDFSQIIIEPLVTEKSLDQRKVSCYVFKINLRATKVAVRKAVEQAFKVKVASVNTCFVRPKMRTTGRSIGRTSRWKKAYVTLAAGQKIQELEA